VSHDSILRKLTKKTTKTSKNQPIKMLNTFFFYVKSVLIPPMLDASMILEQDLMKKNIGFGGLDGVVWKLMRK